MYAERPSRIPGATLWINSGADRPTRVLPDGCIDLMISGGRLLVAGPDTTAKIVPAGTRWIGLRFPPGLAPTLLGIPASELVDARPELSEIWPVRGRPLPCDPPPTAAFLDSFAAQLAERAPAAERWPRGLIDLLSAGRSIRSAARELGWSARQLHRKAMMAFGYAPSVLAAVLRFRLALTLVETEPLADVARAAGYADQPHLARETRRLAGVPMTTLLRERATPVL